MLTSLLEIPLALLSFMFNKAMRFLIGNLYTIYLAFNKKRVTQWQILSAETLEKALSLPVLMTKAPRWNTHAIIGTLGPFKVNQSVSIDVQLANFSSQSWIAIFYSFPGYKTIDSIESKNCNSQKQCVTLQLKPGKYTIGLRYYNWFEHVKLPAIKVDGIEFVSAREVSSSVNQFYSNLKSRRNWIYLWLHYYIFTLLKFRDRFPESFVKKEYLPVGATDTSFIYGALKKAEKLQIVSNPSILSEYKLYLTLYDRSSFPLSWCQIEAEKYITAPIAENGTYLFRIRQKYSKLDNYSLKWETSAENDFRTVALFKDST